LALTLFSVRGLLGRIGQLFLHVLADESRIGRATSVPLERPSDLHRREVKFVSCGANREFICIDPLDEGLAAAVASAARCSITNELRSNVRTVGFCSRTSSHSVSLAPDPGRASNVSRDEGV
jgi:hypothetical protein